EREAGLGAQRAVSVVLVHPEREAAGLDEPAGRVESAAGHIGEGGSGRSCVGAAAGEVAARTSTGQIVPIEKYGANAGSPSSRSGATFTPRSMDMRPMGVSQRSPPPTACRRTSRRRPFSSRPKRLTGVRQRLPASQNTASSNDWVKGNRSSVVNATN